MVAESPLATASRKPKSAAHVEQAFEHPRADVQLRLGLAAHGVARRGFHAEVQRADHYQQQQDQHTGDTRLETTAQFHGQLG
jgi:hypothetical protein